MCKSSPNTVTNTGEKINSKIDESVSFVNIHQGTMGYVIVSICVAIIIWALWKRCFPKGGATPLPTPPPPPPPTAPAAQTTSPPSWIIPMQHLTPGPAQPHTYYNPSLYSMSATVDHKDQTTTNETTSPSTRPARPFSGQFP